MKKLSIFLLGALGMMAATSCEEKIDPATPQANPQEPVLTEGDVVSHPAGVLASDAVLALESYRDNTTGILVMAPAETKNLPAGATVGYKVQISDTEDFLRSQTLDAELNPDGNYYVNAEAWNNAHVYLFGRSPKVKRAYYRVPVYVDIDQSDYRYQSTSYYAKTATIDETCMDMGFVIYDNYYLLGNCTTWDLAAATEFKFLHGEKDVYDDPVFTYGFTVTQDVIDANGGCYIKVASQKAIDESSWDYVYGAETDGDENLEGMLVEAGGAIKLTEAGNYKMTINMEEMTYVLELLTQPEFLYTPGGANGWNQDNSAWMQFDKKNETSKGYYGVFAVDASGFKVCAAPNWDDATTYGAGDDAAALAGDFAQPGNNLAPEAGFYWMFAQYDEELGVLTTYEMTPVTTVGIIGSFAASAWGSDVAMKSADGGITWTCEATLAANDEFKVRFNGNWAYNLGADGILDGDNIKVAEAGTYIVTLTTQPGVPTVTYALKH